MGHLQQKLLNFGWLGAEQAVRLGLGLMVMTLVARKLGPDGFAAYAYIFALFGMVAPLALFGTNITVLRQISRIRDDAGKVLAAAFMLSTPFSIVGILLVVFFVQFLRGGPDGVDLALMLAASMVILAIPAEVFMAYLRACEKLALMTVMRILITLAVAGITLLYALGDGNLFIFTALRGAEAILLGIAVFAAFLSLRDDGLRLSLDKQMFTHLGRNGLPIMLASVALLSIMRIDQIMLGQMASERELGLYGVAARVAEVASVVPIMLHSTLYPAVMRNYELSLIHI